MIKRVFFAFQVKAPWYGTPAGRIIPEEMRHLTVAFLGNMEFDKLTPLLAELPLPQFQVGLSGYFDRPVFLPQRHPHVVAWHAQMTTQKINDYVIQLHAWLEKHDIPTQLRLPWLPHVTLARSPFQPRQWQKSFHALPFYFHELHLYESLPHLQYKPIWSHTLAPPFEEIEHTADLAFQVHGENEFEIYQNAFTALSFSFPPLLHYRQEPSEAIVSTLNRALSLADADRGVPFKAVSHHGDIQEKNGHLTWEMIVDV